MAAPFTADHAMMLLDFSQKLDISLLETVINAFYNSVGPEVTGHRLPPLPPPPLPGRVTEGRKSRRGLAYNTPPPLLLYMVIAQMHVTSNQFLHVRNFNECETSSVCVCMCHK